MCYRFSKEQIVSSRTREVREDFLERLRLLEL